MQIGSHHFREVWLVDLEFSALPGEQPAPVCLVAWELGSGRKVRLWQDELISMGNPVYSLDKDSLLVAYYASAEMGCHLSLGWPMPVNLLDLFTEFRNLTNGLTPVCGNGLLGALLWFGIDWMGAMEKETMRQLALRGGPWTQEEREALLDYCESDVAALARLLEKMGGIIDLPRALLRGRYMKAAAQIEHLGTPIDTAVFNLLRQHWATIQDVLIQEIDADYQVFEGRSFNSVHFQEYLVRNNISWPKLESGALDLGDDAFREMARIHIQIAPLRELRVALSQMRLAELAVGHDGRNRCLLSAFRARTGRNQPSNSRFIFGPSVWLRGLIRPEPGYGLAYLDWSQ
jgi:DNA polymerase I